MDDGPRARWFLAASLAGLLILGGAGCGASRGTDGPTVTGKNPSVVETAPRVRTEAEILAAKLHVELDAASIVNQSPVLTEMLTTGGWTMVEFNTTTTEKGRVAFFSMYNNSEQSDSILKKASPFMIATPNQYREVVPNYVGFWDLSGTTTKPILSPMIGAISSGDVGQVWQLSLQKDAASRFGYSVIGNAGFGDGPYGRRIVLKFNPTTGRLSIIKNQEIKP